jgi:molecular chaperone GrpE
MSEEQDQLDNNPDHLSEGTSEAVIDSEPENSLPVVSIEGLQAEIGDIQQQLAEQEQQVDSLKKRYITLAAEFDNYRKRTAKEKEDIERQVKAKTLSELLAIVDNFERARTQIKPDTESEMSIHKSYQGVYKTLVDSLKRLGVSAMRPEGQMFDPNYHEAMLREYTNEHPEGTIIEQLVRGYLLDDTVLRHAMVKVTALPEPNAADGDDSPREPQSETSV